MGTRRTVCYFVNNFWIPCKEFLYTVRKLGVISI
jgi:hypothetical protein